MNTSEPSFVRRRLGVRLRRLRKGAGMSAIDVATTKIVSRPTLWRIEEGKTITTWVVVERLCQLYGADEVTTKVLVEFCGASKGKGWFEAYDNVVPKGFELYLDCEVSASKISIYDPEVIPGALQTAAYTEAIFVGEGLPRTKVDGRLAVRLERQQRYWRDRPRDASLSVVVSESALAREVGGGVTMGRQLDHVIDIGEWDRVDIRVLPWAAGAHPAIYSGYTIFEFSDPEDPTVVYAESYNGGTYLEDERSVKRMLGIHNAISNLSVPIKEYR